MRWTVVLALAATALAACATGSAGTSASTSLTISYWAEGPDSSARKAWTLRCNPAGGTLRSAGTACRRLADDGVALFAPVRRSEVCTQIYGGPAVARVVGTVDGRRVWATFSRTNGCHIGRWDRLSPWLLPRAGVT
jgi:hypothetical protein